MKPQIAQITQIGRATSMTSPRWGCGGFIETALPAGIRVIREICG